MYMNNKQSARLQSPVETNVQTCITKYEQQKYRPVQSLAVTNISVYVVYILHNNLL